MANSNLKVIVDAYVPHMQGVLEPYAQVRYLTPEQITPQAVKDADALIVRTRTRCDAALLEGSAVQFIATATIGLDHIDQQYCRARGIEAVNAPGCNAPAVAQYVFATLLRTVNRPLDQHTLGIVGVGNVGRIVERWARAMGIEVLLCDPPRAEREGAEGFVSLYEIARRCDIITLHTPLTRDGQHPTHHLIDADVIGKMRRHPILVNAARGAVIDTGAVCDALESGQIHSAIIDCWEGEPRHIDERLLQLAAVATPHIAGYSLQGKRRATGMALEAFFRHFGIAPQASFDYPPVDMPTPKAPKILSTFDYADIEAQMRATPQAIDTLRDQYELRSEPI